MSKRYPLPDNAVTLAVRVRYAETDQMRRAHHANYFVWFEAARSEYCRVNGVDYAALERESGLYIPVVEAQCRYIQPAGYDDEIAVHAFVIERKSRTMRFRYVVTRGDTVLADGETLHMLIDSDGRARSWPEALAAKFVPATSRAAGADS